MMRQRHLAAAEGADANAAQCVDGMLHYLHREPWIWDHLDYAEDPGRFSAMEESSHAALLYLAMAWRSRVLAVVERWTPE